jgi:hypothetical protein
MILITAVVGLVLWLLCRFVYHALFANAARALVIGIIFLILAVGVVVVVFAASHHNGTYLGDVFRNNQELCLFLGGGVLAVFGLAVLFQWIYGINFSAKDDTPTSYIFVIDDSGSMAGNDPQNTRYSAILTVMDNMPEDFPFMVYNFTTDCYVVRDMAPMQDNESFSGNSDGGTDIRGALATVLNDYDAGVWDGGENPKVLLLSDGESYGFIRKILNRYAKEGIAVSTVGFGAVNDSLMQKIADRTGGVYIYVDAIDELTEAIETATSAYAARDLVSSRASVRLALLYGILRILFLTILGSAIGSLAMMAYGRNDSTEISLIGTVITAFLGALVMEVGTSVGLSSSVMWAILWVLIAVLLCSYKKRHGSFSASSLERF